jgi:hypothetical protein
MPARAEPVGDVFEIGPDDLEPIEELEPAEVEVVELEVVDEDGPGAAPSRKPPGR